MRADYLALVACLITATSLAAETGHHPEKFVSSEGRIDWVYVVSNQSPEKPPEGWLPGYRSTDQKYELYVPSKYDKGKSWPLVIFIAPGDSAAGLTEWKPVCEREGVLFASPHASGNAIDTKQRVRIVLDVLDDVRRQYNIDPDRTYIGGFSGGGRIACAIGFSLPEYFGGVVPVCAAGDLREESWLRQRVIDRLSVALLTGESDFNRGEVERFRGPMLADVGVRTRIWVTPKSGHAMPESKTLLETYKWLDEQAATRKKAARLYPALRAGGSTPPTRAAQAKLLAEEANGRISKPATKYSGLMQLKGILERWPDLREAETAREALLGAEQSSDKAWEVDDIAEQRRFLVARARRLGEYAAGPLPEQYAAQRKQMIAGSVQLWQQVIENSQDPKAMAEAKQAIAKLNQLPDSR